MGNLKMDASSMSSHVDALGSQLSDYKTTITGIKTEAQTLSNGTVWKGSLNSDYCSQLSSFLSSISIGADIISKAQNDLSVCIGNDIITDES